MRARLTEWWLSLRGSYWFVPALMTLGAVGLAYLMPFLDGLIEGEGQAIPGWIYGGGAQGARSLLSTIAGSMITVASLTFSITLVALSSAAQQYGPRLLNNFMRDPGYQVVLGTFVAAFLYSVLVLRQIQDVDGELTLPRLAVSFAVALAIAALALLIYFFHHAASSIRADKLVARIGDELDEAIDTSLRNAADAGDEGSRRESGQADVPAGWGTVEATASGYLDKVDLHLLKKVADAQDLTLRVGHRRGVFVLEGSPLIEVWPPDRLDDETGRKLLGAFGIGTTSVLPGDIESALNELREIALRALSPSLNTPNTAIACIDQLARGLGHMVQVEEKNAGQPWYRHYVEGRLRLLTTRLELPDMVDLAFDEIRHHSAETPSVSLRLLEALVALGLKADDPRAKVAVRRQAEMIVAAGRKWPEPWNRSRAASLAAAIDGLDSHGSE